MSWRRSLMVRLLVTTLLVAAVATGATAWLAVNTTTQAIRQEQGRSLADDKSVYDAVLGYAATHHDWTGVAPLVSERATALGRRITLMTEDRRVIADSHAGPSLAAAQSSAIVDPLRLDPALTGRTELIDPRVTGPYLLPAAERDALHRWARFASGANLRYVVLVTAGVLLLTTLISVLLGIRLIRPLRALTAAAGQPLGRDHRVPVTGRDEIGQLAMTLNSLADRRERAEEQRRAMISDVAHELRNPLANIHSLLEAAEDGVTPVDRRLLALLLNESAHLRQVVDDLRDLAAADAGTLRVHPEHVDLGDILAQAADAGRGAAVEAGLQLRTELGPDAAVYVDPLRLRQIVGNLLSNAVRYTPPGGTVTLRSAVRDGEIVIEVADTGIGIDADDLPHVFDRFWRADDSRSRATGGSGLGLSIVRDLIQAHGGTVTATSRPGAGSVFTARLPL
ncbi:ATP-binding protein [Catenuloplanes sp. NPDC051500]|uniref:ATP-binding protein n=1 Tax=Catenuloplanes sp. NPDC051500 TaxID=3363959 RepID=UPI0037985C41